MCSTLALAAGWTTAFAQGEPPDHKDRARETAQAPQASQVYQQLLREALADPQQRARKRAERVQQERASRPDLVRVLDLDARTEEQLINLLADHLLAFQLQADVDPRTLPVLKRAQEYTQRLREIGRVLGAEKLDAYVDYMQTLLPRYQLGHLDSELPAQAKLSAAQKEALVAVFYEHELRRAPRAAQTYEPISAVQESLLYEAVLLRNERSHFEMLARVTPLLTSEQARVFTERGQSGVNQLRAAREHERKSRGAASDEPLPSTEPPPLLTDNVRLRIEIDVNGKKRIETLTSGRGAAMSFEAPDGLRVRAKPYRLPSGVMLLELSFFEPTSNQQRLLGRSYLTGAIDAAGRPATIASSNSTEFLEGRKGYGVAWTFSATSE